MAKRLRVTSVLNPTGPRDADDRVWMLEEAGRSYSDPLPEMGCWEELAEAETEAARLNDLPDTEFRAYCSELANR